MNLIILYLIPYIFASCTSNTVNNIFKKKEFIRQNSCFISDLKEVYKENIFDMDEMSNLTDFQQENDTFYDESGFVDAYPVENWKSMGYFTDDFLKEINPHWLSYSPPSHKAHYIFAGIYLMLAVIGLSGNALVVFMISSFRSLRTPSNILIMNLAISDFLMMAKTPIFVYNCLYFGPVLGAPGCQLYGFTGGLTGTASIMTLAAVALDRYYVIAYPLDPAHKITKIKAVVWITLIWVYSFVFASMPLYSIPGVSKYIPEGYLTSCSFDYLSDSYRNKLFIFVFFMAAWFVPFSIITFSYVGICRAVFIVGLKRKGQEKEKRKREMKLALVVVLVIAMWFVSWTPYATVALLGIFGQKHLITPLVSMIPAIFCKTAACTNPFVYSLNHPRLRKELIKVFCPKRHAVERNWRSTWNSSVNYKTSIRRDRSSRNSMKDRNSVRRSSGTIELENIKFVNDFSTV